MSVRHVSELVVLSRKEPIIVLQNDQMVLRPKHSFLSKVVSSFHLKEDIVLSFLCLAPKYDEEITLHCLDVVWAFIVHLAAPTSLHKSSFFC